MVFCVKCGADNDPGTTKFCRACGTPLAGASPAMAVAPPPPPAQLPVKNKKKGHPVLWVVLLLFVGLVVIASLSRSGKEAKEKPVTDPLFPSLHELQEAQKAGLSKEFATQGWILHRYAMNKFTPLAGFGTDEGLTIPSDEDLRSSLAKLKTVQNTEADKVAFQRMTALLWATHSANQLKSRGAEDSTYKLVYHVADDCFSAVDNSFRGGSGGQAANAIHRCLNEKSQVKADLDKQGVPNWDNL
jgi:hypothetical protein